MKALSRSEIAAMSVDLPEYAKPGAKRHGAPFSKRKEGKARRNVRRAAIARKRAWLA